MKGHHVRCTNSVMPQAPGCVECKTSMTDSLTLYRIASLLSNSTQPFCTLRVLHLAWICLLSFLHRCSSPVRMQSRTSRSTVSRLVMAAISLVLKMSSGGFGSCSSFSGVVPFVGCLGVGLDNKSSRKPF